MQNTLQKIRRLSIGFLNSKTIVFFILILGLNNGISAQTSGSVGIGTTTPNANAILDISSTTKGALLPRLSSAQRDILTPRINAAANGLIIYNNTTLKFNYWDGIKWNDLVAAGSGNEGTVWYAGNGNPVNSTGKASDLYLDNVTGDVYQKDLSDNWVRFTASSPVNLKNANKVTIANQPSFNISANSSVSRTFAFSGAVVGNAAFCSPRNGLPNGIIISYSRVTATNQIEVNFYNATNAPISVSLGNIELVIVK